MTSRIHAPRAKESAIARYAATFALLIAIFAASTWRARAADAPQPQADQQGEVLDIGQQVEQAAQSLKRLPALIKAKKLDEAQQLVADAEQVAEKLADAQAAADAATTDDVAKLQAKIAAARRILDRATGDGAATTKAARKPAKPSKRKPPAPRKKPAKKGSPEAPAEGDGVSFTKQVAPILVAKCSNCHIRMKKGGLSMATFADLMKGSDSGTVFKPGKGEGSTLIDLLRSGDMPRGGGPLQADEIDLISQWVTAGAKFDGPSETAPLSAGTPAGAPPAPAAAPLVRASGSESVQFVRDLAQSVVSTCIDCHGGMQPAGRLNLTTFTGLLRGGDSGPIVVPGKPDESLLIKKLKGMAGQRMPLRKAPLEDALIQKFETWIAEGAKYDWDDPAQTLDWAVRVMVASKLSHEELAAMRSDLADKNWRLASPDAAPAKQAAEQFILLGNLSPARMEEVADLAKQMEAKVAKTLQVPDGEPFLKGKLTVFAFKKHFDYTEFGTMVERRELPTGWHGHWRYNVVDCYGCVLVPNDEAGVALTLAEVFAGAYLENQGRMPRWFSEGAARVIAARAIAKDPLAKHWDEVVREAIAAGRGPDEFLNAGDLLSDEGAALSYGLMKSLLTRMPKFVAMLRELRGGAEFEPAFRKHFGDTPAALAAAWAQREAYRRK
jgi:hypothetical protein